MNLTVPAPVLGIDMRNAANLIDDRAAADGTRDVDFDNGIITTPYGFTKIANLPESGEMAYGIASYKQVNGSTNLVAVTKTKVHRLNSNNNVWDELAGDTINASKFYPVSFANIYHQTAVSGTYQNLLICDGGRSEIVRWPGLGENLAELAGGDGYNTGETGHRALQVSSFQTRPILISPYTYDGSAWLYNKSQIRYAAVGCLETWTGTGSGTIELVDTGDVNVRAEQLGNYYIVYQTNSIWQLRYVGGTTVFYPDIIMPSVGLLSYHLCVPFGQIHYIIGNDYQVYQFSMSELTPIGGNIADGLKRDISETMEYACRMSLDSQKKHLNIFIATGTDQADKMYRLNLRTGSWTVRDLTEYYTSGGITAAILAGASSYTKGQTYAEAVVEATTYAAAVTAATTYADTITEIQVDENLLVGDSNGYVLKEDDTVSEYDGTELTHYYITKEFDGGAADIGKRVEGIEVDAKYPSFLSAGTLTISYKFDNAAAWTDLAVITLTSSFTTYRRFINRSGKKLQLRMAGIYDLRSYEIFNVQPEDRK